jgi:hypothetical protein
VFTDAFGWVDPAVERFCLVDCTRVEACFLSFQKAAALRNENCVLIVRGDGINRYVLQNVFSSLPFPTHYILVSRLKGSPMNDTAVPRSPAPVSLQRLIIRIRFVYAQPVALTGFPSQSAVVEVRHFYLGVQSLW